MAFATISSRRHPLDFTIVIGCRVLLHTVSPTWGSWSMPSPLVPQENGVSRQPAWHGNTRERGFRQAILTSVILGIFSPPFKKYKIYQILCLGDSGKTGCSPFGQYSLAILLKSFGSILGFSTIAAIEQPLHSPLICRTHSGLAIFIFHLLFSPPNLTPVSTGERFKAGKALKNLPGGRRRGKLKV